MDADHYIRISGRSLYRNASEFRPTDQKAIPVDSFSTIGVLSTVQKRYIALWNTKEELMSPQLILASAPASRTILFVDRTILRQIALCAFLLACVLGGTARA